MTASHISSTTDDIEQARQVLAEREGNSFTEKLDWIERSIKAARRLNHVHLPEDSALIDEVKELGGKLLERASAKGIHLGLEIVRGVEQPPENVLRLAKLLDRVNEFATARRILDRARQHPKFPTSKKRTQIIQRRALYTYKDESLPLGTRLSEALEFLEDYADLETTTDQETLGLAGAIHKRTWELEHNERHLRRSLEYYERGYRQKPWADQGYTSINAAYVLDLLASTIGTANQEAEELRRRATTIRREIVADVPPMATAPDSAWLLDEWFYYVTVGEAYFALGDFANALEWLVERPAQARVSPPDWEFETSARQLANLVRIQKRSVRDFTDTEAWKAFERFLRTSTLGKGGDVSSEGIHRLADGKIGLALSGGGFRAALFEIGVLARLAELDLLRPVEVISCVSGGSIIGAHYYLEVRKLLQAKADAQITRQDYIDIVHRLEMHFVAGVQTNIRMAVFADATIVRKMLRRDYSRTTRLGELYEEVLYAKVQDEAYVNGTVRERYMHELVVHPRRADGTPWTDFKPRYHNWRRAAKVPILILNAATLNTGHNWQFTATYMGEAPATIDREIDSIHRLRRKYYTGGPDSVKEPQRVRLGAAVAASSCVPGLFEPLELPGAYTTRAGERLDVKLVDGGVCDNQGVAGLLEQDCTVLLVSDGSGQIDAESSSTSESLSVLKRSDDILQARVRGTQYRDLDSRRRGSMLVAVMFVHLKKDLDNTPVDWTGCPPESQVEPPDDRKVVTTYNVPKEVQRRLAAIRTDLDSFCDQEAYALMLSGYRMTTYEQARVFGTDSAGAATEKWRFHEVASLVDTLPISREFTSVLDAASSLFLKVPQLIPAAQERLDRFTSAARRAALVIPVALLVFCGLLLIATLRDSPTAACVLTVLGFVVAATVVTAPILGAIAWQSFRHKNVPLAHYAMGVFLLRVVSPFARLHQRDNEHAYLARGKVSWRP